MVKDHIDITGFADRVKIFAEEDINELYLITDLLITDYSSVMFDYANLERPMLFFPYDLAHYRDELRGFYFDYDQANLPGPMATDEAAFIKYLKEYTETGQFSAFDDQLRAFNHQSVAGKMVMQPKKN